MYKVVEVADAVSQGRVLADDRCSSDRNGEKSDHLRTRSSQLTINIVAGSEGNLFLGKYSMPVADVVNEDVCSVPSLVSTSGSRSHACVVLYGAWKTLKPRLFVRTFWNGRPRIKPY